MRVRSWTGTETRVHATANHGPWLSIALFLDEMARKAASAEGRKRSAAEGVAAQVSALPVGNHGENKFRTADHAREMQR